MREMNILGVTLARGGSKGIPGKHMRQLAGRSVLAWTVDAASASELLTHYIVSSDDPAILAEARKHGAATLERPAALAEDTTPTMPALQHAVKHFERTTRLVCDYVIEIRATSPFKTTADIDRVIRALIDSGADSAIGIVRLHDGHPRRVKWLDDKGHIRDFLPEPASGRRQDCKPDAYLRNGTVYALTRKAVMVDGKLFGHQRSVGVEFPPERSVNLDTEMDWKLCQLLVAELSPTTRA